MADLRTGIIETARAIGANPLDLATVISYETGGSFDPLQFGPTTQWGRHRGLIQFGEPQARQYGVNWDDPLGSQLGPNGAIANYLRDRGYRPGMGILDLYSTINAGAPGLYDRSDANNGGAPGTVRDKVEQQMEGHRRRATSLLGGDYAQGPQIAADAMRALGIERTTDMAQNEPTGGLLGRVSTQNRGSIWDRIGGGFLADPDRRARIAMALEGMTTNPNVAYLSSLQQGVEQRREDRKDAEKRADEERRRNATIDWLRGSGMPGVDFMLQGLQSGALSERDVAQAAVRLAQDQATAQSDPNVQSVQALPDGGAVFAMKDGTIRVRTAGNRLLEGADAEAYVREAQQYGANLQREIYGAREEGTLGANIEMGGAAEAAKKGGQLTTERAFEAYDNLAKVSTGINNIDEALAALDRGAESGIVYNMLPNVTEASASLENAMNRMGLDVIGSVTFGALSEGEMRLAMETAVPRNLSPEDLRAWLQRKREAQIKARDALMAAARYLSQPGNTLTGWLDQQKNTTQQRDDGLSEDDLRYLEGN